MIQTKLCSRRPPKFAKLSFILTAEFIFIIATLTLSIPLFTQISWAQTPSGNESNNSSDPLPSWADGKVKPNIIEFVGNVTDPASANFISPDDRIAVFDNV